MTDTLGVNLPGPPRLLAIVGPTAVGKTALALYLAERFHGAIISADSRLIYRGMDIGTAKPTPAERARVPHYLVDILAPDEPFGLAQFQELAYQAVADAHQRGFLPMLVGGTGQYVWAVLEGWSIPRVPPQPALRAQLEEQARREGPEALHRRLAELDPVAAERIDPRNVRRVIRALEVRLTAGAPISVLQRKHPPPYDTLIIGLQMDRAELYVRIDARVEQMMAAGLVDEVRGLLAVGYPPDLPAFSSVGYRQVIAHLRGEISLEEAIARIKRDTRRLVHQQSIWFRTDDPRIRWFPAGDYAAVERCVVEWLAGGPSSKKM
ncbi:MAG: tRNA (adenosine(37)-N6)-dimethylallyltransferase MiaA [Anaerolineae bacterium]